MTLRPGDLLGLPPGFPSVPDQVILLRYVLTAIAVLWAGALGRERRGAAVLCGISAVGLVLAFWTAALGRPYGLLVDDAVTRQAAQVAVAKSGGSVLVGLDDATPTAGGWLVRHGLPPDLVIALPTLLPLAVVPAMGLAVFALWRVREQAALAASLWLAFSTSSVEAVRGDGFLPGLVSHPRAALAVAAVAVAVLALDRLRHRARVIAMGAVAAAGLLAAGRLAAAPGPPWSDRLLLATLDQMPWLALALLGFRAGAPASTMVLTATGAVGLLAGASLGVVDGWAAHVLYRLGLLLASAGPVERVAAAAGEWLREALAARGRDRAWLASSGGIGQAAIILALVPGSFLARWRPYGLDDVAYRSLEGIATNMQPSLGWIRDHTPADAVFMASPEYAPWVVVLGQRRVLRVPTLVQPEDDRARERLERRIVTAPVDADRLGRYRVGYLLFTTGDAGWLDIHGSAELDAHPGLRLCYQDPFVRVYELVLR